MTMRGIGAALLLSAGLWALIAWGIYYALS
jgi:hypothetical protein